MNKIFSNLFFFVNIRDPLPVITVINLAYVLLMILDREHKKMIQKLMSIAILLSVCFSIYCNEDRIRITDLAGRTVTIKKNPERIVLVRSRDIYSLAVLLGDELPRRLVGWGTDLEKYDNDGYRKFTGKYPQLSTLPDIGDIFSDTVDPEAVLSLNPDLVILDVYFRSVGPKSCEKMEKAGLPVIYTDQSTNPLSSPQKGISLLAKIFDREERGRQINKYADDQIAKVTSKTSRFSGKKLSVYIETGNAGPDKISSTHGGYGNPMIYDGWACLLDALKIKSIADGMTANGMGLINAEYILEKNPDTIVITGANWNTPGAMRLGFFADKNGSVKLLEGYSKRTGWNGLEAVRSKRIYGIYHGFVMHIFDFAGLQMLARDFYPGEFKDIDPEENLKTFYDRFMPIGYSGTWEVSLK
jgi:iron complex transport system substrate-binding protein